MTTRQRVDLLVRAYPRLFPRAELLRLMRSQLGHVDALDGWFVREGIRVRARAPKIIYHICAGNLAVSAWTSIAHGLLLGAHNIVKLPGEREDSSTRREILDFIRRLPASLRRLVETHRAFDSNLLRRADVVVAFGSDETMASLRAQTRWDQKFIAHGHALSLLWLSDPNRLTPRQARACATDVLTYDQLGCLSPQAVYVPPKTDFDALGRKLATALEAHWQALPKKPARPLGVAARIAEARDLAHALGHRVWLPPKNHLGWTLIHDCDPAFQPSPLYGVIYLRQSGESQLATALASVAGRISTVGVAGQMNPTASSGVLKTASCDLAGARSPGQQVARATQTVHAASGWGLSSRLENVFLSLGVSRFCAAGRMQFPPLTWHHDGRSSLSDLVTWIDAEGLE